MKQTNEIYEPSLITLPLSRAQAITEGFLIDVSKAADELGFKIPVAVTRAVWNKFIDWTEQDNRRQIFQDPQHRLWIVLCMLRTAINKLDYTDGIFYDICTVYRDGSFKRSSLVRLKAIIECDDEGEPVITIQYPYED